MRNAADEPEIPVCPPGELELPSDDGEPMETNRHRQQMILLIQSLKWAWRDRHDYFVGGNMFVYFSETQVKKNDFRGPDFFVVLDTTDRDRRSWVMWGEEGRLPHVVIELLSDRTRHVDQGEKMRIYARLWRTSEYYVYDPWSHEFAGYRLPDLGEDYVPIEPDARGDLPCRRLGLSVGMREGSYEGSQTRWLRFIDAEGKPLETPEEAAVRGDVRADVEKRRADVEKRRAAVEKRRADDAERRLAELERRGQTR